MDVYQDVLQWSKTIPAWQSDVLRQLISVARLPDAAIPQLADQCLAEARGVRSGSKLLSDEDIPDTSSTGGTLLRRLANPTGVNALTHDAELVFSPGGLNVVYGPNGAGKSGYVRVLKQVCRSRDAAPRIWPNVFDQAALSDEQSCVIDYAADGHQASVTWKPGLRGPQELSQVCVFDSGSASVYVNQEGAVAFAPLGLDLLDRLASVLDLVSRDLNGRRARLPRALPSMPAEYQETAAARWLNNLSGSIQAAVLDERLTFTTVQAERLRVVGRVLQAPDPTTEARALTQQAARVDELAAALSSAATSLGDESVTRVRTLVERIVSLSEASRLLSAEAFASEPVPGVGSTGWRALWEAAKRFSEREAYPGRSFSTELDYCVLCQQELSSLASDRMTRFTAFVEDDTNERLAAAENDRVILVNRLNTMDLEGLASRLGNESLGEDLADAVSSFLKAGETRRDHYLSALDSLQWSDPPGLGLDPTARLSRFAEELRADSINLLNSTDPDVRGTLEAERRELEGARWLADNASAVRDEVARLAELAVIDRGLAMCSTRNVTLKANELTDKHVTAQLKTHFENVLGRIRPALRVTLEKTRGQRGVTFHQVTLAEPTLVSAPVREVVSEGEFRSIALAALLAEAGIAPHKSAVVLDDPVSSLDHEVRERAATELVDFAADRQAVVFTHDLFFLLLCRDLAKERGVAFESLQLASGANSKGHPVLDLPWDALNLKKKLGDMRNRVQTVAAETKGQPDAYELRALGLATRMRQCCERAVEEVLIGGCVERFRRSVQTQQLNRLAIVTASDCDRVDKLMSKYSSILHDQRMGMSVALPTPDEFLADIDELDELRKELDKRPA